jgi:electron transfer flavoprotein alpha subunit
MRTWVFAEEIGGAPASTSLEMLTKAGSFGGELEAVYLGAGADDAFAALGAHGATRVFHMEPGDALPPAQVTAAMADLVGEHGPDLILFGMGFADRDVAGRLSARLDRPVLANAIELTAEDDRMRVTNEINGGAELVETVFSGERPWIVVVRPKAFTAEPGDGGVPEVVPVALPDGGPATVVERVEEPSEGPQLEEAAVVVAGGRGMGSEAAWANLDALAKRLGAAVGATRAVVDAGWVPYSLQIGQTGKTVKPTLYLALGLSGAMQHLVGMKDSGKIIAINKDEEAPIFGFSDLGIVGDVHKILPQLLEALEAGG